MKKLISILTSLFSLFSDTLKGAFHFLWLVIMLFAFLFSSGWQSYAQGTRTFTSTGTFTVPSGVTSVTVQVWGGGGRGGTRTTNGVGGGGGGGAGSSGTVDVVPGNNYTVTVGTGSTTTAAGGDSWFINVSTVLAKGGMSVANNTITGAMGGLAADGAGTTRFSGGTGGTGSGSIAGGGGSSAGTGANGVNGATPAGGAAPAGGGNGGGGRSGSNGAGTAGTVPGGGGGGAYLISGGSQSGGSGANGKVVISWTCPVASISYAGTPWCRSVSAPQIVTLTGAGGGTFSSGAGLTINTSTGAITPSSSTAGNYTVTYTVAASGGCGAIIATTPVTILTAPSAPVIGKITQPTCSAPSSLLPLSGLPSSGTWTLTRNPGNVTTTGSGTTTTISGLAPGTYTFTVTNSVGCVSPSSASATINTIPGSLPVPVQTVDCTLGYGHAVITVTSPTGTGLEYNLNGGPYQTSPVFREVSNNSYLITVRNTAGCITFGTPFNVSCGCLNPPTLALSSPGGNTCSAGAITAAGNTFGGSATGVILITNGAGTLTPLSSIASPFAFTYTPAESDGGKTVTITITTNNPAGAPCTEATQNYTLSVYAMPPAPVIGTITNLSCSVPSGSVVLNGLPVNGTWTLTRNPGGILTNGTGGSTTVSGLPAGTYNFIVTSAEGCASVVSADADISPPPTAPSAPVVGAITNPTCAISTGSVVLNGLPATGTWSLARNPGGTITGTGTSTTISALPAGTYTFIVTNSTGCSSSPSGNVVINPQPVIPSAPLVGTITPPSCSLATGSVTLSGLPSTGTWTLIRYPGTVSTTGTGTSTYIEGLPAGTYNYTVTTAAGCLSVPSANVVIPAQPLTPPAPLIGTVTQPTFAVPAGSVVLNGLPSAGTWIITRNPGGVTTAGSGIVGTITDLNAGTYTFTVTNSSGCTSIGSVPVIISSPNAPVVSVTDPPPVCSPSTIDLTAAAITEGSTSGLTYTYWVDVNATVPYGKPAAVDKSGIYYIKGTTVSGYFTVKPVNVTIDLKAIPDAGASQILDYQFSTSLNAVLPENQKGTWSLLSGTGEFSALNDPYSTVNGLSLGKNDLLWSVTNGVCPAVSDTLLITVKDVVVPTLITPNMDGRNDYFILAGLDNLGKTELTIFDRRGVVVFKNADYDNKWDGVDLNDAPLPDDTYFFVYKSTSGKSKSGYIVIRR